MIPWFATPLMVRAALLNHRLEAMPLATSEEARRLMRTTMLSAEQAIAQAIGTETGLAARSRATSPQCYGAAVADQHEQAELDRLEDVSPIKEKGS